MYSPVGTQIHNIELQRGKGGQLVRSAGTAARLVAKEGTYCHVELPSGELRLIHGECTATIGEVGNAEHSLVSIGKAGRNRLMGKRPHVRGSAMNPCDHPHGECTATIGEVGNAEHSLVSIGKAGRNRLMGKRPHVRGSAMNPCDHPHGGGEGKAPVGRKSPLTPWGKPALGVKTRGRKTSDKFIVRGGEGKAPVGRKSPLTPWGKPALGVKTRGRKTSDKFIVRRRNDK